MLQHPFEWLTRSTQRKAFIVLTLCTIAVMTALTILGAPLTTESAPFGIVSFEFAKTPSQAQQIIKSWGQTGEVYAALNLGLDYLFLILYPCSIALGCILVANSLRHDHMLLSGAGVLLCWAQLGAGGLDAVEDFALIKILLGAGQSVWPELAWWCASLKFTIVGVGLAYVLSGTVYFFIKKLFSGKEIFTKKNS